MQYYRLQYIIKILLLNGLFILFSHSMKKHHMKIIPLTLAPNSSTKNGKQNIFYSTIQPGLFYYEEEGVPFYVHGHLKPNSLIYKKKQYPPKKNNFNYRSFINPKKNYVFRCKKEDCLRNITSTRGAELNKNAVNWFNHHNPVLPIFTNSNIFTKSELQPEKRTTLSQTRKRKRSFLQKSPSQEKKTKIQTLSRQELRNLQKPYVFRCKHCPENTKGGKVISIYGYVVRKSSKSHLKKEHPDLYPTDQSIILYLKDNIQYPKKVLQFFAQCPEPDCSVVLSVIEQTSNLVRNMFNHFKSHKVDISLEFIRKYVKNNLTYELITNPYNPHDIGQVKRKITKRVLSAKKKNEDEQKTSEIGILCFPISSALATTKTKLIFNNAQLSCSTNGNYYFAVT